MKVFYNPLTLKIMGMSDGPISMDFPYIETEEVRHSTLNLVIEMVNKQPTLKVEEGKMTEEQLNRMKYKMDKEKEEAENEEVENN